MRGVVPSEAVTAIERLFPSLAHNSDAIHYSSVNKVAGVLRIVDAVAPELVTIDGEMLARFEEARGTMASFIEQSHARGSSGVPLEARHIVAVRDALARCRDQVVPATTSALMFIADAELRNVLRSDITEVDRALVDGEWKYATVVAGSVIEALLLWALAQKRAEAESVGVTLKLHSHTTALERWSLNEFISVAQHLDVIRPDTAAQTQIARDFRNLIHPGKAIRTATPCDRGTARAAAAGVDLVVRDLTKWAPDVAGDS